jgi:hypothetical protein
MTSGPWANCVSADTGQARALERTAGQPRLVSQIGEQTSAGMTDHTASATSHDNLRTRSSTLHSESAFRAGRS